MGWSEKDQCHRRQLRPVYFPRQGGPRSPREVGIRIYLLVLTAFCELDNPQSREKG